MKHIKLFFFGDSICFGQGVSVHKTWVVQISRALENSISNLNITTQNPSINGNTTRMALERMPFDVQSHKPDIVFIQFGLNDCNYWETDNGCSRVSVDAFKNNINEMIDRCFGFGAKHVMLGTNHPTTRTRVNLPHVKFSFETSNQQYNQILREINHSRADIDLLDADSAFKNALSNTNNIKLSDLLLEDGLHLSELGHKIYFESRINYFTSAINKI